MPRAGSSDFRRGHAPFGYVLKMNDDNRLIAVCAEVSREKGWSAEERERLVDLLTDDERRQALLAHPERPAFLQRAVSEMLNERGAGGRVTTSDPIE